MAGQWGNYGGYAANTTQTTTSGVMTVFINGEAGATSYPVAAGNTVNLVDLDSGKMWFKSTDVNGMPCPMRTFEIKEVTPQPVNSDMVSRKEFETLTQQFATQTQQLQNMQQLLMNLQAPAPEKGGKAK